MKPLKLYFKKYLITQTRLALMLNYPYGWQQPIQSNRLLQSHLINSSVLIAITIIATLTTQETKKLRETLRN